MYRGKLKEDSKFLKMCKCVNQQTDIAEDCPGIEWSFISDHGLLNLRVHTYCLFEKKIVG